MTFPKVSLVIPVRNEEKFIRRCLDSISTQDYPLGMEVLIVDGRSTDRTRGVIEDLASKNEMPVRIVDNPKLNQPSGVNAGIKASSGEVILRIDAHAFYAPDYVSKCVEVLNETGAGNVGGVAAPAPASGRAMARAITLAHLSPFGLGGAKFRVGQRHDGEVDTVWPGCFRREVFAKVGLFNEALPRTEDIDFNSRLRQAGYKVWLSPRIRAWYFCRGTLRELWRQNWANGEGIMETLPMNRRAIGLRHLVPLLFVLSLLVLGVAGFVFRPFWVLLGMVLLLYLFLSLFFSIRALSAPPFASPDVSVARGSNDSNGLNISNLFLYLPLIFMTLHLSYGLGSLFRMIQLPFVRRMWRQSPSF